MKSVSIAFPTEDALQASIANDDAIISAFLSNYLGDATQRAARALSSCVGDVSATSLLNDTVVKAPPSPVLPQTGLRILSATEDHIASLGLPRLLLAPSRTLNFCRWFTSFPPPDTVPITATVLSAGDVTGFHQPSLRSTSFPPLDTIPVTATVLHAGDIQGFDQPFLSLQILAAPSTAILKCASLSLVTSTSKVCGNAHTQADLPLYMYQSFVQRSFHPPNLDITLCLLPYSGASPTNTDGSATASLPVEDAIIGVFLQALLPDDLEKHIRSNDATTCAATPQTSHKTQVPLSLACCTHKVVPVFSTDYEAHRMTFLKALIPSDLGANFAPPTSKSRAGNLSPCNATRWSWSYDTLSLQVLLSASPGSAPYPSIGLPIPLFPPSFVSLCNLTFGSGSQSLGNWLSDHSRWVVHLDSSTNVLEFQDLILSSFARASSSTHGPNDANQITPLIIVANVQIHGNVLNHTFQRREPWPAIKSLQNHRTYLLVMRSFNSACPTVAALVCLNHPDRSSTPDMVGFLINDATTSHLKLSVISASFTLSLQSANELHNLKQTLDSNEQILIIFKQMCIAHAHTEESHVNSIMNTQQFPIIVYLPVIKYRFLDFSLQQRFKEKDKWVLHMKYKLFNRCRDPPSHSSPECRTLELFKNNTMSLTRGDLCVILTDDRAEDNQFRVFDPGISFLLVHCLQQFSVWGGEEVTIQTFECRQ